jgi:hypothetical protein
MSVTPRELLGIRDDLAKRVAELRLDRNDAVADLRVAVSKYPELLDKLADDWADTEIDRGVKRYVARRNKTEDAAIVRKLAELGMERPTLDGDVIPISQYDPSYSVTLADYSDYVSTNLAGAWRLVTSFERREGDHAFLTAAVGGDLSVTREQAVAAVARTPEAKRKALRLLVEAALAVERIAFLQQRYGDYGHASEG